MYTQPGRRANASGQPVTARATLGWPNHPRAVGAADQIADGGLREQDPTVGSAQQAAAIAGKFGITVHPRSVERALARAESPKSGGVQ